MHNQSVPLWQLKESSRWAETKDCTQDLYKLLHLCGIALGGIKKTKQKTPKEYMFSGVPGDRTWPCHIESKPATKPGGVTHRQPYDRLKFSHFFFFSPTLHRLLSRPLPTTTTPTSLHLYLSSGTYITFSPVFTDIHKNNVYFGAINASILFPFFAMHIVYEYLKVSGGIYGPVPPLLILSV